MLVRRYGSFMRYVSVALSCAVVSACMTPGPKGPPDIIAPRTFTTLPELVPQIQAVIQGVVEDVRFDYDECAGPRTVIRLGGVETLLGDRHEPTVELHTFGGPLPNGNFMSASELPRYVLGARYLLVLRNTDWRFSPVIGDLALRYESIAGKSVLINTAGFAVTGLDASGIQTGKTALMAPVGQRVMGAKTSPGKLQDLLAHPGASAGQHAACDTEHVAACGTGLTEPGALRAREALIASGRFARPAVLEGVGREALADAISARELVVAIEHWATEHAVRLGGYYSEGPRIGCWGRTPTERPRS
jgi:hypothetical protein